MQEFDLAPITLIYGPNSGGKSSIIQALMLLRQSIEAPINQGVRERVLLPKGQHVDLGQSKSIHHKHSFENRISFRVGWNIHNQPARLPRSFFSVHDNFKVTIDFAQRQDSVRSKLPVVTRIEYSIKSSDSGFLNMILVRGLQSPKSAPADEIYSDEAAEGATHANFFKFSSSSDAKNFHNFLNLNPVLRAEESSRGFGDADLNSSFQNFKIGHRPLANGKMTYLPSVVRTSQRQYSSMPVIENPLRLTYGSFVDQPSLALNQIGRYFNSQFESMSYLGPLRSRPRRLYELSQQYQGSIGSSGEYSVEALRTEDSAEFDRQGSILKFVNDWLKVFEIPYTVEVDDIGDEVLGDIAMLKLQDNRTGIWVAATDVGFGIGQLLPIIIEGALARQANSIFGRERLICVEQPEIHLHPRLQANVADFFISAAMRNSCQWIIETHSEALMLRIQKRIREGAIRSKDVAVVFVEPMGDSGSRILNLRLDESGNFLDEWPGGFFEDSFAEMFL